MAANVEPDTMRGAMARFPTGVTIVSAMGHEGPAGATANAVSSLSLEPPLMLACLDLGSRTLVALQHSGRFGINALAADQADVARRFSTKDPHHEKWQGVEWTERSGVPRIDDSLIWVACEVGEIHEGGDHVIAVGKVLELDFREADPLLFHAGDYRPLGSAGS